VKYNTTTAKEYLSPKVVIYRFRCEFRFPREHWDLYLFFYFLDLVIMSFFSIQRLPTTTAAAFTLLWLGVVTTTTSAFSPPQSIGIHVRTAGEVTSTTTTSVPLQMSKNSDRAFIERSLEDAMNNDWRLFRAQLVAQEKAAEQQKNSKQKKTSKNNHGSDKSHSHEHHHHNADTEVARQGQLSDLFAGAIQNIFKSSSSSSSPKNHPHQQHKTTSGSGPTHKQQRHYTDEELFMGHGIGASSISSAAWAYYGNGDSSNYDSDDTGVTPQDPFATVAELPLWLAPSTHKQVSKHRWAHEITHLEPGCVLLANEKLGGVFHQTVVLIIEHHETTGTFGVVINRYVPVQFILFFVFVIRLLPCNQKDFTQLANQAFLFLFCFPLLLQTVPWRVICPRWGPNQVRN
jgi:hypothetical protein